MYGVSMEKIFVGTTCLLALMDGGLSALILATCLGGGAYAVVNSDLSSTSTKICDAAEESLQRQVDAVKNPEDRKQAQAAMDKAMKKIAKRREDDDFGAGEVARLIALGVFAFPPAAIGVAAHLIHRNSK